MVLGSGVGMNMDVQGYGKHHPEADGDEASGKNFGVSPVTVAEATGQESKDAGCKV